MKFIHSLALCALAAVALNASAVPAKRVPVQKMQPDGSLVTLTLMGDENCHFFLTQDDKMVVSRDGAYYFATVDAQGMLTASDVLAANAEARNDRQLQYANAQDRQLLKSAVRATAQASPFKPEIKAEDIVRAMAPAEGENTWAGKGTMRETRFPTAGKVLGLVILAEYQDVKFTQSDEDTYDYFSRLLNEPGFSDNNATGSAYDFFKDNSMGVFEPEFVVLGPVTLPNTRAYYGANTINSKDARPAEMISDALAILVEQGVDFERFDNDGDKRVDNVFLFYAGEGEAQTGVAESVWPHTSKLTSWGIGSVFGYKLGNVYADAYACSSELNDGKGTLDGIGTFVHEFGHVMGLPDLYNTDDQIQNYTPDVYSTMDLGSYNNNSRTPPAYSIFERNALGWMEPELISSTMDLRLEHIMTSNHGYVITTDNENEFYLLENRQKAGWDLYLPASGMLVWHIDFVSSVFRKNDVNIDPNHQCVDLVEAGGTTGTSALAKRKYPFPGSAKVTSWTDDTTPSMRSWSGARLNLPITEITNADGIVTAKVTSTASLSSTLAPGVTIEVDGRQIAVGDNSATVFDAMGRIAAQGCGTLTVPASGLYIVTIAGNSTKIQIK